MNWKQYGAQCIFYVKLLFSAYIHPGFDAREGRHKELLEVSKVICL